MRRRGIWGSFFWRLLIGLLLLSGAVLSQAQEQCLKLVFNQYCLGGDVNLQLRRQPTPQFQQQQGERLALVYPQGRESLYVLAFRGVIYKVLRKYKPATLLQYQDLMSLLTNKYGEPENQSVFPEYAQLEASRIGAIRRGEGRALYIWRPAGSHWHIELTWTREVGLALAYVADALDEVQKQAEKSGF